MRKKGIIGIMCLAFLMAACSNDSVKANKNMACMLSGEYEEHIYNYYIDINYDDETNFVEIAKFSQKHENIGKEGQKGQRIVDLMSRQSVLSDLKGIVVSSDQKGNSFNYEETWKYNDVDLKEVEELDEIQKSWIDEEHYSVIKIKDYYIEQGYSCDDGRKVNEDLKQ